MSDPPWVAKLRQTVSKKIYLRKSFHKLCLEKIEGEKNFDKLCLKKLKTNCGTLCLKEILKSFDKLCLEGFFLILCSSSCQQCMGHVGFLVQ